MDKGSLYFFLGIMFLLYIALCLYLFRSMKMFISNTPFLKDNEDILYLQDEVKKQMYGALGGTLIGVAIVGSILISGPMSGIELISLISIFAAIYVFSRVVKNIENKIAKLPTESENLENAKKHIIKVWRGKALPNFNK